MLLIGAGLFTSCNKKQAKEEGVYYTCPMHPEVKKDEPGNCPICGMDLVRKETDMHHHGDPNHSH